VLPVNPDQGCQIFLGTKYQNGKKYTKLPQIYEMSIKYNKRPKKWTKCPSNIPTSSIARPSQIYPTLDFWFDNKPSGNPDPD
jgi:hypothetical protein